MNKKLTTKNTRALVDPCIYMLTAPNGKIYVGSSISGFHERSRAYRNENAHGVIDSALKKYGAGNFVFSILESSKDWQKIKLQEREQHHLDTLHPFGTRGYNIERVAGTVTAPTRRVSQFTRAGEPVASYESVTLAGAITGVCATSISSCCKCKLPTAGGFIWLYPEEIIQQEITRRVERAANPISSNKRSVSQYTLAGVLVEKYESAAQAARETGAHAPSITLCCRSEKPTAGGYLWLHPEEITPQEIARRVEQAASVVSTEKRGVSQYTRAGVLVEKYESARQAASETGTCASSITRCCKGKLKSTGGFVWIYSEKVTPQEIARRVEQAASATSDPTPRSVSQYTLAGVLVTSYESGAQAARETGVSGGNINACCRGKQKSAVGFIWQYTK